MYALRISLAVSAIVWTTSACALAQCGLSSWCPFGCCRRGPEAAASVTEVADTGTGVKSPAVLTKVSSGTRRFVTGTMNLLSFKSAARKQNPSPATRAIQPDHKQPGFFYKLFHPAPPPPPKTIDEWMSLEQIHP